jgi:hypothetical protein
MKMRSGMNSAGRVRFTRVVALFLLAYSFADLGCPQYFCEEMLGLYGAGAVSASAAGDVTRAYAVAESRRPGQDQNSGAVSGDEDCFCRSSVLTGARQSAEMGVAHAVMTAPVAAQPTTLLSSLPGEAHLTSHAPPGSPPSPILLNKSIRC